MIGPSDLRHGPGGRGNLPAGQMVRSKGPGSSVIVGVAHPDSEVGSPGLRVIVSDIEAEQAAAGLSVIRESDDTGIKGSGRGDRIGRGPSVCSWIQDSGPDGARLSEYGDDFM